MTSAGAVSPFPLHTETSEEHDGLSVFVCVLRNQCSGVLAHVARWSRRCAPDDGRCGARRPSDHADKETERDCCGVKVRPAGCKLHPTGLPPAERSLPL